MNALRELKSLAAEWLLDDGNIIWALPLAVMVIGFIYLGIVA